MRTIEFNLDGEQLESLCRVLARIKPAEWPSFLATKDVAARRKLIRAASQRQEAERDRRRLEEQKRQEEREHSAERRREQEEKEEAIQQRLRAALPPKKDFDKEALREIEAAFRQPLVAREHQIGCIATCQRMLSALESQRQGSSGVAVDDLHTQRSAQTLQPSQEQLLELDNPDQIKKNPNTNYPLPKYAKSNKVAVDGAQHGSLLELKRSSEARHLDRGDKKKMKDGNPDRSGKDCNMGYPDRGGSEIMKAGTTIQLADSKTKVETMKKLATTKQLATTRKGQPLILLAQFGCAWGKTSMLCAYARYLATQWARKAFLVSPNPWLKHQNQALFPSEDEEQLLLPLEEMGGEAVGVCCVTKAELALVPESVLRESAVFLDEAHQLLPAAMEAADQDVWGQLLLAERIVAVSATFGDWKGLKAAQRMLDPDLALVDVFNPDQQSQN